VLAGNILIFNEWRFQEEFLVLPANGDASGLAVQNDPQRAGSLSYDVQDK